MQYPETINGIALRRLDRGASRVAYHRKKAGQWVPLTCQESYDQAERLGLVLRALGLKRGEKVAIVAQTRPEWLTSDSAILMQGAVVVGIYPTSTAEQVVYILQHSESRMAILENPAQLDRLRPHLRELPRLQVLILMEGAPSQLPSTLQAFAWAEVMTRGQMLVAQQKGLMRQLALDVPPDALATLVYTSGTTGQPKGAMLTHRAFYQVVMAFKEVFETQSEEISLLFLPLAHVLQRYTTYLGMEIGGVGYFAESIDKLPDNLAEVRPTVLATVPRVLEKIHAKVLATVEAGTPLRRAIFAHALEVGRRYHTRAPGTPAPFWLQLQYDVAEKVVFSKIKARLGGRIDRIVSGGAPLSPAISEFFFSMGLLVIEGYGLTETCAPATTNTPARFRFGTVGKALPGVVLRIAEDGEVLIQSPGLFSGYFKDPESTAAALSDGFFHTGDVGSLDADGFLSITDRKKDLIVTAAGKNIAPQPLENMLKQHRLISQVALHGDKRPYLTALITLDEEEVRQQLQDRQTPWSRLVEDSRVVEAIRSAVEQFNTHVAPYETIKQYALLADDFSIERGELTPTLKLKRRVVAERYAQLLDRLYTPSR